jgi:creatinine amidohydrolase
VSTERVRWAELLPDEFVARREATPLVYLPFGLCEPHGHVAALGLDLIKAEWLCDEAARRYGGIVAEPLGWHIHETGYHAPWLAEVVGNENALLASVPPHVLLPMFLYQLRAFANAGFQAAVVLTGHCGGNEKDLALVATEFTAATGFPVTVLRDVDLVLGRYSGDHAGKFEVSQLMALRPDLVDLSLLTRGQEPGSGGRLALGHDAGEATTDHGQAILTTMIEALQGTAQEALAGAGRPVTPVSFAATEAIWARVHARRAEWATLTVWPGQPLPPESSAWYEAATFQPG